MASSHSSAVYLSVVVALYCYVDDLDCYVYLDIFVEYLDGYVYIGVFVSSTAVSRQRSSGCRAA